MDTYERSIVETPKQIIRRRRSVEEKRRIVEETLEAGAEQRAYRARAPAENKGAAELLWAGHAGSRVLWPPELAGTEYFDFKEVEPHTISGKLRKLVLGPIHEYFPSHPVRQFLQSRMKWG